jgi:hypothetical protein
MRIPKRQPGSPPQHLVDLLSSQRLETWIERLTPGRFVQFSDVDIISARRFGGLRARVFGMALIGIDMNVPNGSAVGSAGYVTMRGSAGVED